MEDKGHLERVKMKWEQLETGIKCAYDEMAKMFNDLFFAPWVFTYFVCPKRGAEVLRVVLALVTEAGIDWDAEYDGPVSERYLIDNSLQW